jgi:cobalt-zinc-cadmium efflux system protein
MGSHAHCHHGHSHGTPPASRDHRSAFLIGIGLNVAFVVVEAVLGMRAGSVALVADAGHNLSDVLGLVLAWVAAVLSTRQPTARHTYGLRSSSILAALTNAIVLLLSVGAIAWAAIARLGHPEPVQGGLVAWVAAAGIVINTATALLFLKGRHGDLNVRGAFLHMAADAAVSAGVLISGLVISATGRLWIDPVVSLAIAALITISTWRLLRESLRLALHAVPAEIDPGAIEGYLKGLEGVTGVHDLHIWAMSTTDVALTAHLIRPASHDDDQLLSELAVTLRTRYGIAHATIQIERGRGPHGCDIACEQARSPALSAPDHSSARTVAEPQRF